MHDLSIHTALFPVFRYMHSSSMSSSAWITVDRDYELRSLRDTRRLVPATFRKVVVQTRMVSSS